MTQRDANHRSSVTQTWNERSVLFLYRFRWPLTAVALAAVVGALSAGALRLQEFSDRVTSLDAAPGASPPPRIFDPRTDIWFDSEDSGLRAYYTIEDQFIAEDLVSIAFEERDEPWGVFSVKSLTTIAELSEAIAAIPNVRNVRSLTTNPWIRWGDISPDEDGLLIGDLFEEESSIAQPGQGVGEAGIDQLSVESLELELRFRPQTQRTNPHAIARPLRDDGTRKACGRERGVQTAKGSIQIGHEFVERSR